MMNKISNSQQILKQPKINHHQLLMRSNKQWNCKYNNKKLNKFNKTKQTNKNFKRKSKISSLNLKIDNKFLKKFIKSLKILTIKNKITIKISKLMK